MSLLAKLGIFAFLLTASSAWAGNSVSISSRTAKVFDESDDEVCRLSRTAKVEATALIEESDLVVVKMDIKGCPEEGYISKKNLKGSLKGLPTQTIEEEEPASEEDEPAESAGDEEPAAAPKKPEEPAAKKDCANCSTSSAVAQDKNVDAVGKLLKEINSADKLPNLRSFSQISPKWKKNKDKRKLIQIPVLGNVGNIGPCGSHHYNPDSPPGIDAFVTPFMGCMTTAVMQKWKKSFCPTRSGCTLQWGDCSHGTKVRFPPHATHRDGTCFDIRPMRKGGFADSGLKYTDGDYDRATTLQFINLVKSMGASLVIFNDPKIKVKRAKGHNNHVHVCFKPNKVSQKACDSLQVDPNTCGELP